VATIVGTPGKRHHPRQHRANDVIVGLGGDDTIYGEGGNDTICGDEGNERHLRRSGRTT